MAFLKKHQSHLLPALAFFQALFGIHSHWSEVFLVLIYGYCQHICWQQRLFYGGLLKKRIPFKCPGMEYWSGGFTDWQ